MLHGFNCTVPLICISGVTVYQNLFSQMIAAPIVINNLLVFYNSTGDTHACSSKHSILVMHFLSYGQNQKNL